MSDTLQSYDTLDDLTTKLRDDLESKDTVLIYAHNGTGKTRLCMNFKDKEKDTLYYNAFTEDLFFWDNDLDHDSQRVLKLNQHSKFFSGLKELEMESRIRSLLHRYVDFDFKIDYEKWEIRFTRTKYFRVGISHMGDKFQEPIENIKISRGEENTFIWCFFLSVARLAIDNEVSYSWVKYLYIDDPISSLDDNNAITIAGHLGLILKESKNKLKTIISTHHILFFNVMFNELKRKKK